MTLRNAAKSLPGHSFIIAHAQMPNSTLGTFHVPNKEGAYDADLYFDRGYFQSVGPLSVSAGWAVVIGFSVLFMAYIFVMIGMTTIFGRT